MVKSSEQSKASRIRALSKDGLSRIHRNVPPGVRTLLGLLLIAGGIFGFLPILGFWMIPLGIAVVAMDIRPIADAWRERRNTRK